MKESLLKIINHFGINNQQRKLQEEVFELNEAITRYEVLDDYIGSYTDEKHHIAEEIADCYVLLNQIQEYYQIPSETILVLKQGKINRTLERIENKYYEK